METGKIAELPPLLFSLFYELYSLLLPRMPGFPVFLGARKKKKKKEANKSTYVQVHLLIYIAPNSHNSPLCYYNRKNALSTHLL